MAGLLPGFLTEKGIRPDTRRLKSISPASPLANLNRDLKMILVTVGPGPGAAAAPHTELGDAAQACTLRLRLAPYYFKFHVIYNMEYS